MDNFHNDTSAPKDSVLKELCRIEEDVTYSAKGHYNAAARWGKIYLALGIPASIISAIAGASALSQFLHHEKVAGALAIIVAIITAISTFVNPAERESNHQSFGNKYNALKNRVRICREIKAPNDGDSGNLTDKLIRLSEDRNQLNCDAPQIPRWAFTQAREGIEAGESEYRADKQSYKNDD